MRNPSAKKYDRLTYRKILEDSLGIMDLTAISMCMESKLPVIVFELLKPGNLLGAVCGKGVGTLISG
jgi:uridylate kinase